MQNLAGGTLNITGGTIVSPFNSGVNNAGTMTIGIKDGTSQNSSPVIQGAINGVQSTSNFNFYDGIIKGKTSAVSDETKIADIEVNTSIFHSTELIEGQTYNTIYLTTVSNNNTVTFNANGGTVNEVARTIPTGTAIGTLPTPNEWLGHEFVGWYTSAEGGVEVNENTIINNDMTIYAHWNEIIVATMDGVNYYSIQDAVNAVNQDNVQKTITILHDTSEAIKTKANQNIILDIGSHSIGNNPNVDEPVIENFGTLEVISGEIHSDGEKACIDNRPGGVLKINGNTRINATGTRQAVYNYENGYVEISGNVHLTSTATGSQNNTTIERGTVQNMARGTMVITGGTIECSTQDGVSNSGNLTIGTKDGTISSSIPSITGNKNGILSTGTLNYYDGTTRGVISAISGSVTDIETNSAFVDDTETIGDKTYLTKHLEAQ